MNIPGGGSGGVNVGTATLDFGAFPGASDAQVAVVGQASIAADSKVLAWLQGSTADHSENEHLVEPIKLYVGDVIAGTGFTVYGVNTAEVNDNTGPWTGRGRDVRTDGTRVYGQWSVAWMWV